MFKTGLSPLNPNKDNKYTNLNYNQQTPDYQHPQSYHQSTYQYTKGIYNNNTTGYQNQKPQLSSGVNNYNAPLSPLSPNVAKNPTSPTAKIKMFSNTLNINKKHSNHSNNIYQPNQNTQDNNTKQNKFTKIGVKNLVLDLTESLDLKCDETFDQPTTKNNYRKQPAQTCNINNNRQQQLNYTKRASSKIPVLNFQAEVDDLKCDEILDIKNQFQQQTYKNNQKFNITNNQITNIQNNFTYTNIINKNTSPLQNKVTIQGPLTPTYDKKKANSTLIKKNTDRQNYVNNTSNPSSQNILPAQQKTHSFTNILSPNNQNKKSQQSNEQEMDSSQSNQSSIQELSAQSKTNDELKKYIQRVWSVLQAYKNRIDDMEERQIFLERENEQLRKCLYEDGFSKGNQLNQPHNMTSAGRYQGIK